MANNSRTMAFQIPAELFQRVKAHLERETQRKFVLGLVKEALEAADFASVSEVGAGASVRRT